MKERKEDRKEGNKGLKRGKEYRKGRKEGK